jgi:putative ATP-dependent endonuclease of the OLD family
MLINNKGESMRIKTIHIGNLRAISDAIIELDDYSCFVGANGAGKSTVLFALNVFFREVDAQGNAITFLSVEDFHKRDTSKPVTITVWFDQLSAEAQEDFRDYFRQDMLVVTAEAVFDEGKGKAEIKQYGQRLAMAEFAEFFRRKGDGAKVGELKEIYGGLLAKFADLPAAGTGSGMEEALRKYEAARPEQCALIPSEDQFYGVSKGQGRLQRHIQWVYIPAVKDASSEQAEGKSTALGKLLARTVRAKVNFSDGLGQLTRNARESYQRLLDESQSQLSEVSSALNARLSQWAHPDASLRLQWHQDSDKSIRIEDPFAKIVAGEGDFEGELARFGHGFQRSYLLALLQELASLDAGSGGPRLILGCEEPELYQHPPQARHLASVLQELAKNGSQVLVSTHSPLFIAGESFESVRLVRRDATSKIATIRRPSLEEIGQQVARALGERPAAEPATLSRIYQLLQPQLAEMFFTQRLVLLEGIEDCAYLHAWLALTDRLLDFRKRGVHLVAVGGKSELLRASIIARHMEVPLFVIFDADGDKIEKEIPRQLHERDNRALLRFLGADESDLFPAVPLWARDHAVWPKELSDCVDADLQSSIGEAAFGVVKNKAQARCGHASSAKKHTMLVGAKLAYAREAGGQSPTLDRLCDHLLNF